MPAERWSTVTDVGRPATLLLAHPAMPELLAALAPDGRLHTHRTQAYLCWRYGFEPLAYRAIALADDPAQGVAVFRLRRRGPALEGALCEVLVPGGDARAARSLRRSVARVSGADYVIQLGGPPVDRAGFVRLPGQGPILTWRPLGSAGGPGGTLDDWALALGDIELF